MDSLESGERLQTERESVKQELARVVHDQAKEKQDTVIPPHR